MPKRVRLTERRNRQAVDGSIPYPGNVNQPDRQFKKHDQYDNWEEVINHPLPDMRHDWKNDERDEIGFGIPEPWGESPTVASVKVAANKAVKLAYLLLGNKVAEGIIEDQANDFMLLGPEAMDRTLARFAQTGELYAQDEEEDDESEDEGEEKTASEPVTAEDKGKEEEEKAAESIQEKKEEEAKKEASEALAEEAAEDEGAVEDSGASEVEASDKSEEGESKEAAEKTAEDDDDADEGDDEGDAVEASEKTANDMDIELTSTMDDGATVEEDSRLAGLFDDDIPEELPEPGAGNREASSKKQGIKSLGGGQPKVASGDQGADISSLWADAPDLSDLFQ
jgi:hypothetical protein